MVKRVTDICIVEGSDAMYEKYKEHIPKEFKKRFVYNGGQLNLPLEPDSPIFKEALADAEKYGMHPRLFSVVHYTKKELDEAPFFYLDYLRDPLELEGGSVDTYGTKYEVMCPECGFCSGRISDILIDRKYINHYKNLDIGELYPNLFVSGKLKRLIEENGLTGVSFEHRVLDYKQREMPEYYAMTVHHIMPPLSETTWLNHSIKYDCGHEIIYLESDIQYEREKLDGAMDFNLTCEFLNNGQHPIPIVSARVRELFREHKIREHFIPVAIL